MFNRPNPHPGYHVYEPKIYNEYDLIKQWAAVERGSQFSSQTEETVAVINCGKLNRYDGPDFLNATIIVDGRLKIGSIECHVDASDWYKHKHDKNSRYNNVILHVVNNYSNNRKNPNIPTIRIFQNSTINRKCLSQHQIKSDVLLDVLQHYAEQRWKLKTKQYLGLHSTSLELFHKLITTSYSILGANGNKENFIRLSKHIDLDIVGKITVDNIHSYLLHLSSELNIKWNAKSIRPAHRPNHRMRLAAELINFFYSVVSHPSIDFYNVVEQFYSRCPSACGRGIQTELIGNVLIPLIASHNLHNKQFEQYSKLRNEWFVLKISTPYHKYVKRFSRVLDKSSLNYFWVMQGAIQMDKVWCRKNLCNICPMIKQYGNS